MVIVRRILQIPRRLPRRRRIGSLEKMDLGRDKVALALVPGGLICRRALRCRGGYSDPIDFIDARALQGEWGPDLAGAGSERAQAAIWACVAATSGTARASLSKVRRTSVP